MIENKLMALKTDLLNSKFEFDFSDKDFNTLRDLVTGHTGIELPDNKKTLMYTRLVRRLRELSLPGFQEYIKIVNAELENGKSTEMMNMVNAMTTNVTGFFRENHHFEDLAARLPELYQKMGKLRIWSCAASTGQEPWSIAMVVHDFMEKNPGCKDVKIVPTDIDVNVIRTAEAGIYEIATPEVESNTYLKKYLKPYTAEQPSSIIKTASLYRINDKLRDLVQFHTMNLLKSWAVLGAGYNVVFCRNVIIYFSKETQRGLFKNISAKMPSGSLLYIGHSESLLNVSEDFSPTGRTSYFKK